VSKDPAFLFYSSDFMTGTFMMTDAQVGKYIRLICLQHQHGRLSEKQMLTVCKKKDADIWDKFQQDEQGLYYNERLDVEVAKRQAHSQKQRENVQKRWNKTDDESIPSNENGMQSGITVVIPLENENENINRTDKELEIIAYLNLIAGTKYKPNSKETKKLIRARLDAGFAVDDFKTVIDKQWAKWKGTEWEQYMRPSTLFSPKFESYLNGKVGGQAGLQRADAGAAEPGSGTWGGYTLKY